jgi:hypothetical protein
LIPNPLSIPPHEAHEPPRTTPPPLLAPRRFAFAVRGKHAEHAAGVLAFAVLARNRRVSLLIGRKASNFSGNLCSNIHKLASLHLIYRDSVRILLAFFTRVNVL